MTLNLTKAAFYIFGANLIRSSTPCTVLKILAFFAYIPTTKDGERLIVKIKSSVAENEIYDTFAIIYRRYKILKQSEVGEYFFKETSDLVNKLCDDFEKTVREENS